ncbi:hypothetical protein ABI59_23640 [Acidobacteria bacterium Mor1]|nr:hypothetical protein ABI59_23640 [Acidobacteria bacterium Mor1]
MKPRELLASTVTPDGMSMTLTLHAGDYYIDVDGDELMSTRAPGSEQALATLAADELNGGAGARVLIGGLGLGFTLEAAREAFPADAKLTVVEYFEIIVDWNRKFSFASTGSDAFEDPRVRVEVDDVVRYLGRCKPFDAILLDVDNGPDAWTLATNDRLYDHRGLARIDRVLAPGGLLAVWSAAPSRDFESRLQQAGFEARSETVRSRGRKGQRHTIFLARKPAVRG